MSDMLAALSGGRLVSLSERELSVDDILYMHNHPRRRCPECEGSRITLCAVDEDNPYAQFVKAFMPEHLKGFDIVAPQPCPMCGGTGLCLYITTS